MRKLIENDTNSKKKMTENEKMRKEKEKENGSSRLLHNIQIKYDAIAIESRSRATA